MPRQMRRVRQALTPEENRSILERAQTGVLAVHGEEGYPYPVPINFVLLGSCIYMHCAKEGHKIDAIRANSKAAFCVIDADKVVPETYSTDYRSVIAFGNARIVEDEGEIMSALHGLGFKYNPGDDEGLALEIEKDYDRVAIIALDIDYLTGKEGLRLSIERRKAEKR